MNGSYMLHPPGIFQEILFSFCCVDFMSSQTEVKVDYNKHPNTPTSKMKMELM